MQEQHRVLHSKNCKSKGDEMNKTIIIMDAPDTAAGIEEIGEENPFFLGAFGEVIGVLKRNFPDADFSDPTDIGINTEYGTIKIQISKHTPVQNFTVTLDDEKAVEQLQRLCSKTGWRALDTETGRFIDSNTKAVQSPTNEKKQGFWTFWKK